MKYRVGQQLLKVRNKAGNYVNVHSIQELRKSEEQEDEANFISSNLPVMSSVCDCKGMYSNIEIEKNECWLCGLPIKQTDS